MSTKDKAAAPLTEEQLKKREALLKENEQKLESSRKTFDTEKSDFEKAKSDFEKTKSDFETEKSDFEKAKSDFEKAKSENSPAEKTEEIVTDFKFEGDDYEFTPEAPQVINFAGQKFTRKELVENNIVLTQLIGGKSILIQKKS